MTREQHLLTIEYIARLLLSLQNGSEPPLLPDGVDLVSVYQMSSQHLLSAATYSILADRIKSSNIPEEYKAKWEREAELAVVKHVKQTAGFAELTSAFTDAKIRFLPIKGFILKNLWSHPELRTMSDIDILVPPEDFERAEELLVSSGYRLFSEGEIHLLYIKNGFVNVEMHRTLYLGCTETFTDWQTKSDNPCWYKMPYDDLLLFFVRHSYKHYGAGGCGLRAIFDLYLLFEKYGSPDHNPALLEKLNSAGLYEFYRTMTSLVDLWFYGKPDVECLESALYVATGGVYGTQDNKLIYSLKNNNGGKTKHVLTRLFPPYKMMALRYRWVENYPILLPIAYVVRFFTGLFKKRVHREMKIVVKTDTDKKI